MKWHFSWYNKNYIYYLIFSWVIFNQKTVLIRSIVLILHDASQINLYWGFRSFFFSFKFINSYWKKIFPKNQICGNYQNIIYIIISLFSHPKILIWFLQIYIRNYKYLKNIYKLNIFVYFNVIFNIVYIS